MSRTLVGVDWGTTALRVARIDATGSAIEERSLPQGILSVPPGGFPAALADACGDWLRSNALVLVCGMAGSRQGWAEAPYCACPAGFPEVVSRLHWIEPGRIAIVPGLSCEHSGVPDVMRGEETQVFGALSMLGAQEATLVLPGTHSKWVRATGGRIEAFTTFMTGEVFALLRNHSILARTMTANMQDDVFDEPAFNEGVQHALRAGNLLATAFSVRTRALFERISPAAAPSYLSGLVIGEELRSQQLDASMDPVVIIAAPGLARRYEVALRLLGVRSRSTGSQATWRGVGAIAQALEHSP